ncbi:polysaccharide biosynthesis protein [sediment metagenome]|uniref:Polysaccharide biosynthesis protein n=1 Tax=sediment metagenome TaxID=749907 RepID=D9PGB9_9ZZZZ
MADTANFAKSFVKLKKWVLGAAVILVSLLMLFSKELVHVFLAGEYNQARYLIPIVAFSCVFSSLGGYYSYCLLVKKQTGMMSVISIGTAGTNVVLNIILIPKYGIYAAAITTVFSYLLSYMVYTIVAAKTLRIILRVREDLYAFSTLGAAYFISFLLSETPIIISIPVKSLVFILIFFLQAQDIVKSERTPAAL